MMLQATGSYIWENHFYVTSISKYIFLCCTAHCAGAKEWTGRRQGNMAMASNSDPGAGPIVIKKYANRRLYNTGTSTYVTLEDLAAMVKEGEDFLVYDAKTGDDITRSVLAQIIFEQENKAGQNLLPTTFLRQLIRFYGDSMQMLVPRYLEVSIDTLVREFERPVAEVVAEFGRNNVSQTVRNLFDRDPPYVNTNAAFQSGYDPQYADPRGRFVYFWNEGHPGTVIEISDISGSKGRFFEKVKAAAANWAGQTLPDGATLLDDRLGDLPGIAQSSISDHRDARGRRAARRRRARAAR